MVAKVTTQPWDIGVRNPSKPKDKATTRQIGDAGIRILTTVLWFLIHEQKLSGLEPFQLVSQILSKLPSSKDALIPHVVATCFLKFVEQFNGSSTFQGLLAIWTKVKLIIKFSPLPTRNKDDLWQN